ncbi:MAG: squalene--hopene cyclase [Chloroflexi bacterium]|nr:squalene--hopene cyclase [Chloroflexota bacterium]
MTARIVRTKSEESEGSFPAVDPSEVERAISITRDYLLKIQNSDGYWVGELEADPSVSAGYIPLMYFLTGKVDPQRARKILNHVKNKQKEDGSWSCYFGGPGNLNATIQTYFAMKLAGISPEEPFMRQARKFILTHGGLTHADVLTKIWLAVYGQFDWRKTPTVPPETIFLPNWFYFNIYEFASWSRATILALMVISTTKPVCQVPEYARVPELYVEAEDRRDLPLGIAKHLFSRESLYLWFDNLFKIYEKMPFKPGRALALRKTAGWIIGHQEADGGWGGIMLPWVYSLIALKSLGRPLAHPAIRKGIDGLEGFIVEDSTTFRLQPAVSPVWDTAWTVLALAESGLPAEHPALVKAARWLLKEEVRTPGDWKVKSPKTPPGCWAFEFENDFYPDIDDTAVVPRALRRARLPGAEEAQKAAAINRGLRWALEMQSDDGGWAAFDRNNNRQILEHIPFADFMTPLDPTSPDVTAHVLELIGELDVRAPRKRALAYIRRKQEPDGSWYGRWGVNYIYGTGLVLAGLRAMGENMKQDYIRLAASWLESHQNQDGGWGESCYSYYQPSCCGLGQSTASQTAWALLGLLAADKHSSPAIQRGISYLLKTRQTDGTWLEEAYTGTGFPRAFYLRYDLYRIYFPLLALAKYQISLKES